MIDLSNSNTTKIIGHRIGNKLRGEDINYSDSVVDFENSETRDLLLRYLLSAFGENEVFSFHHDTDLSMNEIYSYASKIFNSPSAFVKQTKNIALHLYNESVHPKVNYGEVYLIYMQDCVIEDEMVDAIGIFKSETKDFYLRPSKDGNQFSLQSDKGVRIDKPDKGCLIFNTDQEEGYKVCVIDNTSKGEEAKYWMERFLKIAPRQDAYHSTKNYLSLAKNFVTKQLEQEYELSTADKAEYLNRSVDYFKSNEQFNEKSFAKEVFGDENVIKSFSRFKEDYADKNDLDISDDFMIAPQVVKKHARAFKSVLKLDKNFDIYIHGNTELIEKGFDSKTGKHFYKIYFDKEV